MYVCCIATNYSSCMYIYQHFVDPRNPMTNKKLPEHFEQNCHVFEKLKFLEEHEELQNIVILDYGSLSGQDHDLNIILSCWFLKIYFHVVVLIDDVHHIPNTSDMQNCTVVEILPQFLRRVKHISYHIATQIMMYFSNGLFQTHRCRRAYYCLSENTDFPDGFQFMEYTGTEHVYCCVLRSVKDFLDLQHYFKDNINDPTKMNVCFLLKNDFPRNLSENSGKLMFFVQGEFYYRKHVTTLWKELRKFGNEYSLPVSVTTAFPSVKYEVKYCKILW